MASNHVTPRAFLAKQMQRLRAAKGISREELARMLPVSDALVRAWETSQRLPQPDHLGKLEEIFDTKGILAAIREDLVKAPVPLEWFGKWPEIESQASSLWDVETTVIPGLLQIEEYARIVFASGAT